MVWPESLGIAYMEAERLKAQLNDRAGYSLAQIFYGAAADQAGQCPVVNLDLPQLLASPLTEIWTSTRPVNYSCEEGIRLSLNDQILFGYLHEAESDPGALDNLTYQTYRRILNRTKALGYPYLLRVWNFFPDINSIRGNLERYQRFCIGRHQAFAENNADFQCALPAATTIGTGSGPLQICFFAGTRPGCHIENPRQVSAYNYPQIYGPKSPSFARATLQSSENGQRLFIAGTASIVGHASQHVGDPCQQARETLENIEAVIRQAGWWKGGRCANGESNLPMETALLKVYVRDPDHLEAIKRGFVDYFGFEPPCLYLKGDICRGELLLEIEGILTRATG
jgi:chorismate lyase/3-hydroxybenzoate synthase